MLVAKRDFEFGDKTAARDFFTRLTGMFKNLNYAAEGSQERGDLRTQLLAAIDAAPQRYQAAAE